MPTLSENDIKILAQHIAKELVNVMTDEEEVKRITDVWGKYFDRWLGRGIRRVFLTICAGVLFLLLARGEALWAAFFGK